MNEARPLWEVEAAQRRILTAAAPLPPEWVPVGAALGRALSEAVLARRTLPPWDNSAMDGYAVRSADLAAVPTRLEVVETVYAGARPTKALEPGQATRVMTGAPIPEGADAVVMQERTRRSDDGRWVEILEAPSPRQFVRDRGEDARAGGVLLGEGTVVGIPEAALLWAQSLGQVRVPRRPRVALLATGDELCRWDAPVDGRIVDTNSPALAAAVASAGGVPTILGIARDDPAQVRALFEAASGYDVIISSAGVSVGERDFVRDVLGEVGIDVAFAGVAIKPGKPLVFGTRERGVERTLYFGLPGNPASSLVTFEVFVRPALRRLQGIGAALPQPVPGRAAEALRKAPGLTHFVRVTCTFRDGALWASPLTTQVSGALRSTAQATHLLVFPKDARELAAGDPVMLLPVPWASGRASGGAPG